jgi:hypothetical protein
MPQLKHDVDGSETDFHNVVDTVVFGSGVVPPVSVLELEEG